MGALDLWELSVLPMLLSNSGTWTRISESSLDMFDELQHMLVRIILHLPVSTPKPILTFDTGLLSMHHRVMATKLNLAYYLGFVETTIWRDKFMLNSYGGAGLGSVKKRQQLANIWVFAMLMS